MMSRRLSSSSSSSSSSTTHTDGGLSSTLRDIDDSVTSSSQSQDEHNVYIGLQNTDSAAVRQMYRPDESNEDTRHETKQATELKYVHVTNYA